MTPLRLALLAGLLSGCSVVLGIEDRTYGAPDAASGGARGGAAGAAGQAGPIAAGGLAGGSGTASGGTSDGGAAGSGPNGGAAASCESTCVPVAPIAWTGPFWYFEGPYDSAPSCPGGTMKATTVFDGISYLPPSCSACTCSGSAATCTTILELNCMGAVTEVTVPAQAPACVSVQQTGVSSIAFLTPAVASVSCQSGGGTLLQAPPDATWSLAGVGCTPTTTSNACPPDSVCSTPPPSPFSRWCVSRAGDVSCPAGPYSKKTVHFTNSEDTRACAGCTCAPPPPDTLCILGASPVVFGAQDAECTNSVTPFATAPETCVDASPSVFSFAKVDLGAKPDPNAPGCKPTGGGPAGVVMGKESVTICCSD